MVVVPGSAHIVATALAVLIAAAANADAQAQRATSIAEGDGIFIDGRTFALVPRKGGGDAVDLATALGVHELGQGTIIFRLGDRLYIADAPSGYPAVASVDHDPISVAYEPPTNPEHQKVYELIKERRVLEILKGLLAPFRLPVDLEIKTVGCDGVSNAFFDRKGKQRTIRMCYEFLQIMLDELPDEESTARSDALIGQLALVLLHEAGHAIYDIFEVPILGTQEDAADQFAVYVILQFGGERAYRMIRGAAHSFKRIIADIKSRPDVTLPLTAFSSDHSRPEQRFFNMACIAYGYDPKLFASVIDEEWLPEKRAGRCKAEYQDLTFALRELVGPHVDKALARKALDTKWIPEESPAAR